MRWYFPIPRLVLVIFLIAMAIPTRFAYSQTREEYTCGWFYEVDTPPPEGALVGRTYSFFAPYSAPEESIPVNLDLFEMYPSLVGSYVRIYAPEYQSGSLQADCSNFPNLLCLVGFASYEVVSNCEPIVDFSSDQGTIMAGACTTLRWYVQELDWRDVWGVSLNGEEIPLGEMPIEGSRQVCPLSETTYVLEVSNTRLPIVKEITVYVMTPTPTSLPPTATPIPTPTPQPTPASPVLEVSDVQVEPPQVSVFELVRITMVIENRGAPLNQPFWGYMGEVILESENGEVIERHSFAKGDASFISPIVEGGQINPEKWLVTVKVRFGTAVSNGRVIVSLQPNLQQQSELRGEGRLNISPSLSGLTCTSVIVNKLVGSFSSDVGKDLLDAIIAELQASRCEDGDVACAVPPLVKGFVRIVGRATGALGKVITGIWGVFDTDALQVCGDPVDWMWQLVREFNRQGVPISVSGVHSPMTILVTNSAGQRAGFISEDEMVTEIPDSQVIEWEGDKYVIYPASPDITISLQATGDGTASIGLIDGQSGREVSYTNIAVSDGDRAQIDLSEPQSRLVIDTNDDGNPDKAYSPVTTEMLRALETPTASAPATNPPGGICGGSIGLIVLPFFIALILARFHKPGGP